jgi:hypothetical protein
VLSEKALFGATLDDMLYGNGVLGATCPTMAHAVELALFLEHAADDRVKELTLEYGLPCLPPAKHH